jgi:branched-chain amino acid transport system ATP-binding protein
MPILHIDELSVTYGGVRAVDAVSLSIEPGEAVGLIGPNGAGKSSFLDGMTGLTPAAGRVWFQGKDISDLSADQRARLGLRRTWQSVEAFDDLTVGENVAVSGVSYGMRAVLTDVVRPNQNDLRERSLQALRMFDLEHHIDSLPHNLPLGMQKLVGVTRALSSKPPLIALDEPAAGLDKYESQEFGRHLRQLVTTGISLLLIDHDMDLVLSVCDRIYVLDFGRLIAQGTPSEIWSNREVLRAYLGREVSESETQERGSMPVDAEGAES